jgi:hypothetical protein
MMAEQQQNQGFAQKLSADLFLLHAPSVYDFRERDDILFAYLSDSDSVNVTSIYEMYPIGFFSMKQRLREHGFNTEIVNLASLMLMHPQLDVERLLASLEAPVFGFDLHWMAQCHGSIELATKLKAIHPESLIIFGGIGYVLRRRVDSIPSRGRCRKRIRYTGTADTIHAGSNTRRPYVRPYPEPSV